MELLSESQLLKGFSPGKQFFFNFQTTTEVQIGLGENGPNSEELTKSYPRKIIM